MELVLELEHLLMGAAGVAGAIWSIWRLWSKIRTEALSNEMWRHNTEGRLATLERHDVYTAENKDKIIGAINDLREMIRDLRAENVAQHAALDKRLSLLEATGCAPVKAKQEV